MDKRWNEIRKLHIDHATAYRIMSGFLLVGIGIWLGGEIFHNDPGYTLNIYTEVLSVSFTVFVLNFLIQMRETTRTENELKARLIREMKSKVHETAIQAVEEIYHHNWHTTGLLSQQDFSFANLKEALLKSANLSHSSFYTADLQMVDFSRSNLQCANMFASKLNAAHLINADCRMASFRNANLENSIVAGAKFEGANLQNANLEGVIGIHLASFNEHTILPDNTHYLRNETDLKRFTDSSHDKFYRTPSRTEFAQDLINEINEILGTSYSPTEMMMMMEIAEDLNTDKSV